MFDVAVEPIEPIETIKETPVTKVEAIVEAFMNAAMGVNPDALHAMFEGLPEDQKPNVWEAISLGRAEYFDRQEASMVRRA